MKTPKLFIALLFISPIAFGGEWDAFYFGTGIDAMATTSTMGDDGYGISRVWGETSIGGDHAGGWSGGGTKFFATDYGEGGESGAIGSGHLDIWGARSWMDGCEMGCGMTPLLPQ